MNNCEIIYQMFLRTFTPEGTLNAAAKLLPHIKKCGFTIVYLCPVCCQDDDKRKEYWSERQKDSKLNNPKNPYRISDYYNVDPEYGTNEDLKVFISAAHKLGLKVILDLVYFHCGPKAVVLEEQKDFVKCDDNGEIIYGEWHFPTLNFENPALREYLWKNMEYYVKDFNVDGYRCDVAYLCPTDFWEEGRKRIEKIKPDVFMLNEGENKDALKCAFDANYHYDYIHKTKAAFGGYGNANEIVEACKEMRKTIPEDKTLIRAIDTHDETQNYKYIHPEVHCGTDAVNADLVLAYMMDGIPFIFNGYEIADDNYHSIYANRFYGKNNSINWCKALTKDGIYRKKLIKKLSKIRKQNETLYKGKLEWIENDYPDKLLSFKRIYKEKSVFVCINTSKAKVKITFPKYQNTILSSKVRLNDNVITIGKYGYFAAEIFR